MAACVVNRTKDAERAICRLVEETSGHETLRYFGPGCLVKFEKYTQFLGTAKSRYFLVSSKEVLAKGHLEALRKQQEERRTHEPSVKMVAEFLGLKNRGTLERIPLGELYVSIKGDVFELHGITYVALTKWEQRIFGKSSLLNRALEVVRTEEENSSGMTSDQLECLFFRSQRTINIGERNVGHGELSTNAYVLLQFDRILARDESRFPSYFLRNEEKKRFLREDDFGNEGTPLGSIIVNQDCEFVGVLDFSDGQPEPVFVGSVFDTGKAYDM